MEQVLKEVKLNLDMAIKESQAQIKWGKLPTVKGDHHQMVQLLQNLIGNSLKFTAEGRLPVIEFSVKEEKDYLLFTVSDNGIGIKSEYLEKIFVIFQRLHTRTKYPGNGIGLALCKRIVERHGGKIWCESVPNEGTTFHFTLPKVS